MGDELQQLLPQRRLETHVLCALDGQPVPGVVVDHLGDGEEATGEVAQLEVSAGRVATDLHVHEALGAPVIVLHELEIFSSIKFIHIILI